MGYNTKIDWCDTTWNPVTGCLHSCEYCYAKKIAERFSPKPLEEMRGGDMDFEDGLLTLEHPVHRYEVMEDGLYSDKGITPYPLEFTPTFHKYRLDMPKKWTKPRTIFVCSMADLFGEWVPHEWIFEVFKVCRAASQHRYLFLTKNPKRYSDLFMRSVPDNVWLGASYTGKEEYERTSVVKNRFLSIEPLLNRIPTLTADSIALWNDWVIIGAETGTRKDKVKPEKEWIDTIVRCCDALGTPVFMKESLREIMGDEFKQEFPWKCKDASQRSL